MSDNHHFVCQFCVEDFSSKEDFNAHKETNDHRIKYLNRTYASNRKSFVQNKNGLTIEVENEGPVEYKRNIDTISIKTDEEISFEITLYYVGTDNLLFIGADILNEASLLSSNTIITLEDRNSVCKREKCLKFSSKSRAGYPIKCNISPGSVIKALHIPIIFQFQWMDKEAPIFYFGKNLEISGINFSMREFGDVIPGVRLSKPTNDQLESIQPLSHYPLLLEFIRLAHDNNIMGIREIMQIEPTLNRINYVDFFKTLLWLEELQLHLDIQYYSQKDAKLTLAPNESYSTQFNPVKCAELKVEGLSENRPSVLLGDKIMASPSKEAFPLGVERNWYEGIVHNVTNSSVYLGFDPIKFMRTLEINGLLLADIEFLINRRVLRVCHRAIAFCSEQLGHLLFPAPSQRPAPPLPDICTYNEDITSNLEQLQAVKNIVAGSSYPSPYLIFGPPGTGKTVTVVEAIKQVLYNIGKSHVLACAPSNSAADILTGYLLKNFSSDHVYRLYAASRAKYAFKISEKIKNASNLSSDKVVFPPKIELMKKRVIVCTYITAARIASASFPPNFFTHIFLDEVGQAMEPEALVAIGGILSPHGHLILAGDHHQLGPVVRNMQAKGGDKNKMFPQTGLQTSYLERLMSFKMYQEDTQGKFNPRFVTKLLNNYRSHKEILKVPNELFYKSQLKAKGERSVIESYSNWKELPKKGFPLIFHSIAGQDKMVKKSPSYYNEEEISIVMKYLKKLLDSASEFKLTPNEIGIITPYRLQVEKIRNALRRMYPNLQDEIKVGSVEDFQGEERRVILISTVRGTKVHLAKDEIFVLGFLRNPKRFNVAVTRAKSLLIVCGCASILQMDKNWKELINHIKGGGGFRGSQPPRNVEDLDSFLSKIEDIDSRPMVGSMSVRQIVEAPCFAED